MIEVRVHLDEAHTILLTENGLQLITPDTIVEVEPDIALRIADVLHDATDVIFREAIA